MIETSPQPGKHNSEEAPMRKHKRELLPQAIITKIETQTPEGRIQPFDGTYPPKGFNWLFSESVAILISRGPDSELAARRLLAFDPNPNPTTELSFGEHLAIQTARLNSIQSPDAPSSLETFRTLHLKGQTPASMDSGSYLALFLSRLNEPLTRDQLSADIRQLYSLMQSKLIHELRPRVIEQVDATMPFPNVLGNLSNEREASMSLSNLKSWYIASEQSWKDRAIYWEAKRLVQGKLATFVTGDLQQLDEPLLLKTPSLKLSRRAIRAFSKVRKYDSLTTDEVLEKYDQATDRLKKLRTQKKEWERNVAGTVEEIDINQIRRETDLTKSEIFGLFRTMKERKKSKPKTLVVR